MHSTKKSKKKTKKKERSEPMVSEPPAPRYDPAFLAKIFNKNKGTTASQGTNTVATATPIQSSKITQQTKTKVKSQPNTSGASQTTTPSTNVPPTSKQKTPTSTQKGPSSSAGKAANVKPAQPTPVTSQAATKQTPVVQMQPTTGNYYSRLAARKYDHIDRRARENQLLHPKQTRNRMFRRTLQ
jgi:hypothetical protein